MKGPGKQDLYTEEHDDSTGKWSYSLDPETGDIVNVETEEAEDENNPE